MPTSANVDHADQRQVSGNCAPWPRSGHRSARLSAPVSIRSMCRASRPATPCRREYLDPGPPASQPRTSFGNRSTRGRPDQRNSFAPQLRAPRLHRKSNAGHMDHSPPAYSGAQSASFGRPASSSRFPRRNALHRNQARIAPLFRNRQLCRLAGQCVPLHGSRCGDAKCSSRSGAWQSHQSTSSANPRRRPGPRRPASVRA